MKKLTLLLVIPFLTSSVFAQEGIDIAKAADKADLGWESSSSNLKMVLKNKNGQTSSRSLSNKSLELVEDGDKSLIIFNSPADVKGTATLTYTHKVGTDDQWLYLPAIARVKRISSSNKSGPFMGSEFAYEDLSSQEVEKYTYKFLEKKGSLLVVEQFPVDPKSGYTRRIATYNPAKGYRIEKVEFYDRKNARLKTLTYSDYNVYKGKYWRPGTMLMVNHQSNKETTLFFTNYKFGLNYTDDDFSQNALKRAGN
jgi:outer membrane lipoprotein-sorting protein